MTTQPPSQIGRYRIERELGRGTMGIVYQAQDTTLGRTVALKTFGTMAAVAAHEREAFEQRFLSEARISATLDDENVVGVYDVGRDFETGLLYMALEYVRGETLADSLSRGPMPWEDAAHIISKVARALQAAHSHHIVHRDIKPANIMLTPAGEPKIMDFGIAKASVTQLTVAGQVFGTPAYMSPEQAQGEEVDGRSDIFSLGCVLYELVTNVRPFEGPTMAATLTKILRDEPRPASSIASVPRALDAILTRALRKQRSARYDTAAHFASDLEQLIGGEAPGHATELTPLDTLDLSKPPAVSHAPRRASMPSRRVGASRAPESSVEADDAESETKKKRLAQIAAAATVLLGVAAVFGLQRGPADGAGPTAAVSDATGAAPGAQPPAVQAPVPGATSAPSGGAGTQSPNTPASTVLSVTSTGEPASVYLDLRYPFASGTLRVKADDRVIFAGRLNGMPIRTDGVTTGYDGRLGTELVVPSGDHALQVEIRSGETAFIETTRVRLGPREKRRLVARLDKTLVLTLE